MAIVRAGNSGDRSGSTKIFNVKDYGARGNGTTNDTAAINAAITAMPSLPDTFNGVAGELFFPAGRYMTDGGHTIPPTKRCTVRGAGPYVSIIYKRPGSTADMLTISAANTGVVNLTLDGNRTNAAGGDLVVLDSGYTYVRSCTLTNAYGNGITVGKTGAAILHRIDHVDIRLCRGYGIQVVGSSGSSDGNWSNVDIGQCGLSGARIGTGAQLLSNVHSWGNGLEDAGGGVDRAGFWLNSSANHLVNCEAETNLGRGFYLSSTGSDANSLAGCFAWGNVGQGVYGFSVNRTVISGCSFYNNGVSNTAGASSTSFAGITNDTGTEWAVSGNNIWDNGVAVPAGSYATAPTNSYPGRSAVLTQSYGYAEVSATNNAVSGNVMRKERTRSGNAYTGISSTDVWAGNIVGAITPPAVASAANITAPATSDLVEVTGSAVITSISAGYVGRRITLRFSGASPGQVTDGSNLVLAGNFTPTIDDTLTLICDGTNWYETGRSAN